MDKEKKTRCQPRVPTEFTVLLRWATGPGAYRNAEARGVDLSKSGVRVLAREPLQPGDTVTVNSHKFNISGPGVVRYCTRKGSFYSVGIQFSPDATRDVWVPEPSELDYYEILQISPNAEQSTIHRVYRILAARFHPDNLETGDPDRYRQISEAHLALTDPSRRAEYDRRYSRREPKALPVFELRAFVDGIDAEVNRRLGILCLLYNQRRYRPDTPGLSVLQLETLMAIPREHLSFTVWYLKEMRLVSIQDNSDYALTAVGADYVESRSASNPLVGQVLAGGQKAGDVTAEAGNSASGSPEREGGAENSRLLQMRA